SRLRMRRTGTPTDHARVSRIPRAAPDQSTAVTCWPRAARSSVCLPLPHAMSSAGPDGRRGNSSRTMLAGSEAGASAASLCFASHSDWPEGIKKAPELKLRSPRKVVNAVRWTELNAERTATAAGALDVGIVELESRTLERLDIINFDSIQIHGTHLVDRDLQTVKLKNLVRIAGLVFKRHVVLETGAAAAHHRHPKGSRHGALHVHDFLDLGTRYGRQMDHKFSWPPLAGTPAQLSTLTV